MILIWLQVLLQMVWVCRIVVQKLLVWECQCSDTNFTTSLVANGIYIFWHFVVQNFSSLILWQVFGCQWDKSFCNCRGKKKLLLLVVVWEWQRSNTTGNSIITFGWQMVYKFYLFLHKLFCLSCPVFPALSRLPFTPTTEAGVPSDRSDHLRTQSTSSLPFQLRNVLFLVHIPVHVCDILVVERSKPLYSMDGYHQCSNCTIYTVWSVSHWWTTTLVE